MGTTNNIDFHNVVYSITTGDTLRNAINKDFSKDLGRNPFGLRVNYNEYFFLFFCARLGPR